MNKHYLGTLVVVGILSSGLHRGESPPPPSVQASFAVQAPGRAIPSPTAPNQDECWVWLACPRHVVDIRLFLAVWAKTTGIADGEQLSLVCYIFFPAMSDEQEAN